MSEYGIAFHLQEDIMKSLPVKSLIRFRSVSKAWKSLINSSQFIAAHSLTQPQHLLVSYEDQQPEEKYVCYIDDDTFPQQRSVLKLPPPLSSKQIIYQKVVGSSRGLVCLYGWDRTSKTHKTLVWNPSIRKYIFVDVPARRDGVGFGVCPVTNDPKIVSVTQPYWDEPETSYRCEVMVYTLSSGKWRSLSTNLPTKRIYDLFYSVVTDGFIYWFAVTRTHNMIMSFDVTNESFQVIHLPDTLARHHFGDLYICKLRESLAFIQFHIDTCTIWMMEDGVQRSFTKLLTVDTAYKIMGFRKSGVPIMQVIESDEPYKLVVYEPKSEHDNVLEIGGSLCSFTVNAYMETLLLLGRSDCISY